MVKAVYTFMKLSVSYIIPYEHDDVQIKQAYGRTSRRRRARTMETVGVMERRYEKARYYEKEKEDRKLRRSDKKLKRIDRSG